MKLAAAVAAAGLAFAGFACGAAKVHVRVEAHPRANAGNPFWIDVVAATQAGAAGIGANTNEKWFGAVRVRHLEPGEHHSRVLELASQVLGSRRPEGILEVESDQTVLLVFVEIGERAEKEPAQELVPEAKAVVLEVLQDGTVRVAVDTASP